MDLISDPFLNSKPEYRVNEKTKDIEYSLGGEQSFPRLVRNIQHIFPQNYIVKLHESIYYLHTYIGLTGSPFCIFFNIWLRFGISFTICRCFCVGLIVGLFTGVILGAGELVGQKLFYGAVQNSFEQQHLLAEHGALEPSCDTWIGKKSSFSR